MSDSILTMLRDEGPHFSTGYPWGSKASELPISAFTANVLCRNHNSALHHFDDAGAALYRALNNAFFGRGQQQLRLSGHDLERFLLQRLCAQHFGGVTSVGATKLHHHLSREAVFKMMYEPHWKKKCGLYIAPPHYISSYDPNKAGFENAPIISKNKVLGWRTVFTGLYMVLLIDQKIDYFGKDNEIISISEMAYRPRRVVIGEGYLANKVTIDLSWLPRSGGGEIIHYPYEFATQNLMKPNPLC